MVSELANYIIEQLQKGYSRAQLKEHLADHGYNKEMIAAAFAEITHDHLEKEQPDLKDYVESYISQGYKAEQLYSSLKDEGYSKKILDKTFKQIGSEHFEDKEHKPGKKWKKPDAIAIIMILPIVLFILVLAYLFNTPSGEIPLVDDLTELHVNTSDRPVFEQTEMGPPSLDEIRKDSALLLALRAEDKETATGLCQEVIDENKRDICYQVTSETYNDPNLCQEITSIEQKDNCYMTFIIAGETTFCSELVLDENKNACLSI